MPSAVPGIWTAVVYWWQQPGGHNARTAVAPTPDSLGLHRAALAYHLARLGALQDTPPAAGRPDDALRIAACDALGWAIRLYDRPTLTKAEARATAPVRDDRHHVASGAAWARTA